MLKAGKECDPTLLPTTLFRSTRNDKILCVLPPLVGGGPLAVSNSTKAPGNVSKTLIFSEFVSF